MKAAYKEPMANGHTWKQEQFPNYKDVYDRDRDWMHQEFSKKMQEKSPNKKKMKPDPATVEAALRLEEELWNS